MMTVNHVEGRSRPNEMRLQHRSSQYDIDRLPKVKTEAVVLDENVTDAVRAPATKAGRASFEAARFSSCL